MIGSDAPIRGTGRSVFQGGRVAEMQRRRLLFAMREVVGERGLHDATVGAVCRRSRVSRRTFYELFEDRDACFLAAFEQALEELAERVLPAYRHEGRWRDRIRAGLEALLGVFDEQPQLARLCVLETLKGGGPRVLARRRRVLAVLAGAVDEGRGEARTGSDPPVLTAENAVGGTLAVVHARLLDRDPTGLSRLVPSLTAMIVLPYLGQAASRRELQRPPVIKDTNSEPTNDDGHPAHTSTDPFRDIPIRFTYRTARVLQVIGAHPGASNRQVGQAAGASDVGQMSKLLKRLQHAGLIENDGRGRASGEPNAWRLTHRGKTIQTTLGTEEHPPTTNDR
jgi:AcrR family transcriptional regulator